MLIFFFVKKSSNGKEDYFMVKIIKQELEFKECLKQRLEFICEFSKVTSTFVNGNIRKLILHRISQLFFEQNVGGTLLKMSIFFATQEPLNNLDIIPERFGGFYHRNKFFLSKFLKDFSFHQLLQFQIIWINLKSILEFAFRKQPIYCPFL